MDIKLQNLQSRMEQKLQLMSKALDAKLATHFRRAETTSRTTIENNFLGDLDMTQKNMDRIAS